VAHGTQVIKPDDFDKFWEKILEELESIPLNASVELDPFRSSEQVEVFEVKYDSLNGLRIAGWYCLPRERSEPLPARVFYPGYISEPTLPKSHALQGYATFGAAPRGKLGSNKSFNPGYPGLLTYNINDRDNYGYKGFYIDAVRVIDFLLQQPEVDSNRIGIQGSSQGGALTLVVAALRQQIRAASAGAPYLAGVVDAFQLTRTYPYEEINDYLSIYPEKRSEVANTWNYYDCFNFAERIQCPIIVYIGLQDDVCPPETAYPLMEKIGTSEKKLYEYDGHGHDANHFQHDHVVDAFFDIQLKKAVHESPSPRI
jgi:cephalosporin-C deacetylase